MLALITSRKFWASFIALLVIVLSNYIPDFALNEEQLVSFLIIAGSFVVGVAIDPGGGWKLMYKSRKFWTAIVGAVLIFINAFEICPVQLSPEQFEMFFSVFGVYILGVSAEGKTFTK